MSSRRENVTREITITTDAERLTCDGVGCDEEAKMKPWKYMEHSPITGMVPDREGWYSVGSMMSMHVRWDLCPKCAVAVLALLKEVE